MSIDLLKKAIEYEGSLAKVGEKIGGISKTTISFILNNKYPPKPTERHLRKIKEVYGFLENSKVLCPIVGEMHKDVCVRYKKAADKKEVINQALFLRCRDVCIRCAIGENTLKEEQK